MTTKDHKRTKQKTQIQHENTNLMCELKHLIKHCNEFLKNYFSQSEAYLSEYGNSVKEFFIEQSTSSHYSCLIGSLLSKISNILQPFLSAKTKKNTEGLQMMKQSMGHLQHQNQKLSRKIKQMKDQIEQYRKTTVKITSFIYMLRKNNIDVDGLYEHGCSLGEIPQSDPAGREEESREGTCLKINRNRMRAEQQQYSPSLSEGLSCYTLKNFETN